MDIFEKIIAFTAEYVPDWIPVFVCPALALVAAVLFTVFGGRRAYAPLAFFIGGAGIFAIASYYRCAATVDGAGIYAVLAYAGIYIALASLFALLFLIPCPFQRRSDNRAKKEKARDEAIYQKFHEELSMPPAEEEQRAEDFSATAEECGTSLSYVTTLLVKLKKEKLSPADRLEADALTRTVEGYRGKTLNAQELSSLNDCLSSVLKMTAKYKL